MKSRFPGAIALILASIVGILVSCSGGGDTQQDQILEDFDLIITANPNTGNGPVLTVSFFAVPSGGIAPYSYAWDFDADGITDSNSSNGVFTYTESGIASVTVTDSDGKEVIASRTITVVPGVSPQPDGAMTVSFEADPQAGNVPFASQFIGTVHGGVGPYEYKWDFNGDGITDSYEKDPYWVFEQVGHAITDILDEPLSASATTIITNSTTDQGFPPSGMLQINMEKVSYIAYQRSATGDNYVFVVPANGRGKENTPATSHLQDSVITLTGLFIVKPLLEVTDSQGVSTTNFNDNNSDGFPDWEYSLTVNPPQGILIAMANANPLAGQAPLTVEFTGAVANGTGNYAYMWEFGDGLSTEFRRSSIATHTYLGQGSYKARVTVYDLKVGTLEPNIQQPRPDDIISQVTSAWISVNALAPQAFSLEITSDIVSGQVPFVVNFEANVTNGSEPIQYHWDIFNDTTSLDDDPTIAQYPGLDSTAVITPKFTYRKNPTIHFANVTPPVDDPDNTGMGSYVARCVAQDAAGNTVISENLIRITTTPNTSFPYYMANRPEIVGATYFPPLPPSSQATTDPPVRGPQMSARANPAVATHPTGVSFIFGGEVTDENGIFEDLVTTGDSAYMYVPETGGTTTGSGAVGKFSTAPVAAGGYGGGVVLLNDRGSPGFPAPSDAPTMPAREDGLKPPGFPGPGPDATNRSTGFNIVGSAAAVYMHEQSFVETNSEGAYQAARGEAPPNWKYPDSPSLNWGMDDGTPSGDGLGVPVIFVMGGRTDATTPSDLVQKYYPYGFGTEDLFTQSIEFGFQTTGNQTDTWSTYFLRPDRDQFPDSELGPPDVDNRTPGNEDIIPTLPVAVYGLMAVAIETGVHVGAPTFPGNPFKNVFIFGGIDGNGSILRDMRRWDTSLGSESGDDEEIEGVFSIVEYMPTARAYGQAVLLPGPELQIALVGGVTTQGVPLDTIDIFTFDDAGSPTTGSWETFENPLPVALEACGAGFLPGPGDEKWVMAFGGWTGEDFNSDVFSARVNSLGNVVVNQGLAIAPRSGVGAGQGGSDPLSNIIDITFNRFVMIAGVDENGTDSVIEVFSLP